jgi:hypothetical protein
LNDATLHRISPARELTRWNVSFLNDRIVVAPIYQWKQCRGCIALALFDWTKDDDLIGLLPFQPYIQFEIRLVLDIPC